MDPTRLLTLSAMVRSSRNWPIIWNSYTSNLDLRPRSDQSLDLYSAIVLAQYAVVWVRLLTRSDAAKRVSPLLPRAGNPRNSTYPEPIPRN